MLVRLVLGVSTVLPALVQAAFLAAAEVASPVEAAAVVAPAVGKRLCLLKMRKFVILENGS